MHLNLTLSTASEYAEQVEREVDFENEGIENAISSEEYDALQQIITCEISVDLLRSTSGICGINSDTMRDLKCKLIVEYESTYNRKYIVFNEYE
jgi:hypothetical protein